MRTYYSLVGLDGYIDLSRYTTDANDPLGQQGGRRLLPDVNPEYDPLTQRLIRVEPVAANATAISYEIVPLPQPEPQPNLLTKRAFRDRFTMEEKVAIEIASLDDPTATTEVRAQKAALRVYLKDTESALYIDLESPSLIAGIQSLVTVGLLTQARADAILTTPASPEESPPRV